MLKIEPGKINIPDFQGYLFGAVAPRPIAFASTVDKNGQPNLSPFSFFNAFGVNPPTLIFSPSRRGRDNTTKHSFENVKEVPEVVINVVSYDMVQQTSLTSTEYPKAVDEFVKAGFTKLKSDKVKPFRVKESPVQFECKVNQIIETGQQGGAGNLVICEIVMIHISEKILDKDGKIDQQKIDLVGRLGGNLYCRASGDALFTVPKPLERMGIGIDSLPDKIKNSHILTGNDLGQLGNIEQLPTETEIEELKYQPEIQDIISTKNPDKKLHELAKHYISTGNPYEALKILMI